MSSTDDDFKPVVLGAVGLSRGKPEDGLRVETRFLGFFPGRDLFIGCTWSRPSSTASVDESTTTTTDTSPRLITTSRRAPTTTRTKRRATTGRKPPTARTRRGRPTTHTRPRSTGTRTLPGRSSRRHHGSCRRSGRLGRRHRGRQRNADSGADGRTQTQAALPRPATRLDSQRGHPLDRRNNISRPRRGPRAPRCTNGPMSLFRRVLARAHSP